MTNAIQTLSTNNLTIAKLTGATSFLSPSMVWAGIIISGILFLAVIFWLFIPKLGLRDQRSERIIVVLLFMAAAMLIGILFGLDASTSGKIGAITFAITGPFAAAVIGSLLYTWVHTSKSALRSPLNDILEQIRGAITEGEGKIAKQTGLLEAKLTEADTDIVRFISDSSARAQSALGLVSYDKWRNSTNYPNICNSDFFLRNLLEIAFNPFIRDKLTDVTVSSLFICLDDNNTKNAVIYKFEHVTGKKPSDAKAAIRLRSTSSFGHGKITSIMMQRDNGPSFGIKKVASDADNQGSLQEGYFTVIYDNVECLTISRYTDVPETEDYILVAASRFTNESSIKLRCAIGCIKRSVTNTELYDFRQSLVPFKDNNIPLVFRKLGDQKGFSAETVWETIKPWIAGLFQPSALEAINKNIHAKNFLEAAKNELKLVNATNLGVFQGLDFKNWHAMKNDASTNALMLYSLKN